LTDRHAVGDSAFTIFAGVIDMVLRDRGPHLGKVRRLRPRGGELAELLETDSDETDTDDDQAHVRADLWSRSTAGALDTLIKDTHARATRVRAEADEVARAVALAAPISPPAVPAPVTHPQPFPLAGVVA